MNSKFVFLCMTLFYNIFVTGNKFCVNCKFRINPDPIFYSHKIEFAKCKLFPKNTDLDDNANYLVSGENIQSEVDYNYCAVARTNDRMCGEEGAYYKPKPGKKWRWRKRLM